MFSINQSDIFIVFAHNAFAGFRCFHSTRYLLPLKMAAGGTRELLSAQIIIMTVMFSQLLVFVGVGFTVLWDQPPFSSMNPHQFGTQSHHFRRCSWEEVLPHHPQYRGRA